MIRILLLLATLKVTETKIVVDGREATRYAVEGYYGETGKEFDVQVENHLPFPTSLHWHGLILPNKDDGVAFITQFPIYPGDTYGYKFPLVQSGTYFLHSHYGLQEQRLLAAPLILTDPDEEKMAEAVMLLSDFTFKEPEEIYRTLRCPKKEMSTSMNKPDIVDVQYDAFLTNYKTFDTLSVQPGQKLRLRIINAASSTNFFLNLGTLEGAAIAVDGHPIEPLKGSLFELGVAQRIDIVVTPPSQGTSFPILAQGEGTAMQTGLILTTDNNKPTLNSKALQTAGRLTNGQEKSLRAVKPLESKPVDRKLEMVLGGDMATYSWTINGQSWPESTPLLVEKGERVEVTFKNTSMMSHPMHLHGHVFEVTSIDGKPFRGAMRDTVLVGPKSTLTIEFDANNPGVWPFHCHLLYHMEAGMFTVLKYSSSF